MVIKINPLPTRPPYIYSVSSVLSFSRQGPHVSSPKFQRGSGVHTTSYSVGTGGGEGASSPRTEQPGREVNHSLPSSVEVRICGVIHPFFHMRYDVHRVSFVLLLDLC